jgi:hypothetical protein
VVCGKPVSPRLYPPLVSVKDRWVDPREQVLNIPIACRRYGPSKPNSWLLTEDDFTPTPSMAGSGEKLGMDSRIGQPAGSGEKLGMDPQIGQPARCGLCRKPFFSGAVPLSIVVEDFTKCCHVRGLPIGSVHRTYVDWRGKRTCRIGRVFPCMVYIDLNHRDSRI